MPPPHNSAASKHLSAAKDAAAHVGKEASKGGAAVPPASNAPFWQVCLAALCGLRALARHLCHLVTLNTLPASTCAVAGCLVLQMAWESFMSPGVALLDAQKCASPYSGSGDTLWCRGGQSS